MARTGGGARVVAGFDASGEQLALLTADGRLKLWETATGKLAQSFSEPDHLVQVREEHPTPSSGKNTDCVLLSVYQPAVTCAS